MSCKLLEEVVVGRDGRRIGTIADLVIDVRAGDVAYAVIARAGAASERMAVAWSALELDADGQRFVLDEEAVTR